MSHHASRSRAPSIVAPSIVSTDFATRSMWALHPAHVFPALLHRLLKARPQLVDLALQLFGAGLDLLDQGDELRRRRRLINCGAPRSCRAHRHRADARRCNYVRRCPCQAPLPISVNTARTSASISAMSCGVTWASARPHVTAPPACRRARCAARRTTPPQRPQHTAFRPAPPRS
jgi:hypothetical protein